MSYSWIYDIEIYRNVFTLSIIREDRKVGKKFEISFRKDQRREMLLFLKRIKTDGGRMVGFNNIGFDYPLLHYILENQKATVYEIFQKANSIIESMKEKKDDDDDDFSRFRHIVPEHKVKIPQIDLYKIHHFDNKARATGLKMLEFNMRSDNIEDLPYSPGTSLKSFEIDNLLKYNCHDVLETLAFYEKSKEQIAFRESITVKYGKNFMNHNDTKIGKDYFIMELERLVPGSCYTVIGKTRKMRQTHRKHIDIKDIIFPYVNFERDEFKQVVEWFKRQRITETKGVFSNILESDLGELAKYAEMRVRRKKLDKAPTEADIAEFKKELPLCWVEVKELKAKHTKANGGGFKVRHELCWREADCLNVVVDGFRFDFGTGGIHGSVASCIVKAEDGKIIRDWDVASMYPNIAISNRVYPKHLGEKFCDIYEDVYNQRTSYAKGTAENAMLKLALNGVYGDSNNQYSPFYDPQYTMSITINGQLSLCMLAERLKKIPELELIQVNTDGVTAKFPEQYESLADSICEQWQKDVKLQLEKANYTMMCIRDVNNYIAAYEGGKLKRKGAYEYAGLGWHQNQGGLVIAKAAEAALVRGENIDEFINNHQDKYDFMLRTKVPRSSKLTMENEDGSVTTLQNICRYYISDNGGYLVKVMPPIEGKEKVVTVYQTDKGEEFEAKTKPQNAKAVSKNWPVLRQYREAPTDRKIGIETGWKVKVCNKITDFSWDINYEYYIREAKKLVDPLITGVDNSESCDTIDELEENDED